MATIRELIVQLRQRGGKAVSDALVKVRENSDATRKAFGALTDAVVADSARMATALREVRGLRLGGLGGGGGLGGSGGGGGGGRRPGRNQRVTGHEAGDALSRGSAVGRAARNALGAGAGGADRARADVDDLSQAIDRNRRELQRLRAEAIRTGDADGKLAAQTRGLTVATSRLTLDLRKARGEVAAFDKAARAARGGAGLMSRGVSAISVAAGNLLSGGISRAFHGISDAIVDSGEKAIEFEKNMSQVAKVVDGLRDETGKATPEFDKMSDGIKKLSSTIGLEGGAGGFASIIAEAGQSGLESTTEGLLKFGEDAAKVAVAFNVTAEDSGKGLAQLRNGLVLTQEEVVALAGTYNLLDTKGGAAAKDLLEVGTRIGAVGKAANVSGQEIAAFSSVMLGAGETPERAATATKNFVLALSAGESATKRQRAAFKALGLDAKEVAVAFTGTADARAEITNRVLEGLKAQSAADQVSLTTNIFGEESLGGIAALTTNVVGFNKALETAMDTTAAAASLESEFAIASKTTANQLQLVKNNVDNAKAAFGDALLPILLELAPTFIELAQGAAAWLKENKDLVSSTIREFISDVVDRAGKLYEIIVKAVEIVGKLEQVFGFAESAGGRLTGIFDVLTASTSGLLTVVGGLLDALLAFGDGDIAGGFVKLGKAIFDGIVEPLRASARQVIGLADAIAGVAGANIVPDALREFAGLGAKAIHTDDSGLGGGVVPSTVIPFAKAPPRTASPAPSDDGEAGESLGSQRRRKARKKKKHGTKMDANLARLNPELAGVLVQGGDEDSGGDLKVHDDPLSRAAYKRSAGIGGGIGNGGTSGPNITNNGPFTWNIEIDARGNESAEAGVYAAGEAFARKGEKFVLTGLSKVLATVNAGGRLMPP